MKYLMFSLVFLFGLVGFSYAGSLTLTDNFDDPSYTGILWSAPFGGSWSHPSLNGSDLGYYGTADSSSDGTAVFVGNQQLFSTANLWVDVSFCFHRDDASIGFLIINNDMAGTGGTYNEYGIFASKDPDESDGLNIWYNSVTSGGETNTSLGSFDVSLGTGTFYRLHLLTDSGGNITLSLFSDALPASELGTLHGTAPVSFSSGIVGIATSNEATFNNFSLSGNTVPIPGTVLLMGIGLLSVAGMKRKTLNPII